MDLARNSYHFAAVNVCVCVRYVGHQAWLRDMLRSVVELAAIFHVCCASIAFKWLGYVMIDQI